MTAIGSFAFKRTGRKVRFKAFCPCIIFLMIFSFLPALLQAELGQEDFVCSFIEGNAREIIVPDHYNTIQDAINNASNGDIILVRPNLYLESVVLNKSVSLLGEDNRTTIISGGTYAITIVASNTIVNGFTILTRGDLGYGIRVEANSSIICNNIIKENFVGVKIGDQFHKTMGNVVQDNNITRNRYGVFIAHSNRSLVKRNIIHSNDWNGLEVDWGGENIVCGNTIFNNVAFGLEIPGETPSHDNIIYHNNFVNNTEGCASYGQRNRWDNGYPVGGNFWNTYNGEDLKSGPNQDVSGYDGIGDTAYALDEKVEDRYPLVGALYVFKADRLNGTYPINIVSNSTVFSFNYEQSDSRISFQVKGSDGTIGFCRTSIPHALMTEPYNITIDGSDPILVDHNLFDNVTHRWIYFAYQHSIREVVIVPEFSIVTFFLLTIVATVISLKSLFVKSRKDPACASNS